MFRVPHFQILGTQMPSQPKLLAVQQHVSINIQPFVLLLKKGRQHQTGTTLKVCLYNSAFLTFLSFQLPILPCIFIRVLLTCFDLPAAV